MLYGKEVIDIPFKKLVLHYVIRKFNVKTEKASINYVSFVSWTHLSVTINSVRLSDPLKTRAPDGQRHIVC